MLAMLATTVEPVDQLYAGGTTGTRAVLLAVRSDSKARPSPSLRSVPTAEVGSIAPLPKGSMTEGGVCERSGG
jgi:hypothetical protein